MTIDLDELKPLTTRHGPARGKALENRWIDSIGGQDTIRKKIITNADGSTTLVHTRGPGTQPEVITSPPKLTEIIKDIRTFVFNTYTALSAVVANYRITLTNALAVGKLTACYSVFPYRTKVKKFTSSLWNDVCRLDHDDTNGLTTVKVNSFKDFLLGVETMQIPYVGIDALPHWFIEGGAYNAALTADASRSPLFVSTYSRVYSFNSFKSDDVLGVGPSCFQIKEYITPSYVGFMATTTSAGRSLSDDGVFTYSGSTLLPNENDEDTTDGGIFAWAKIKVTPSPPFLQEIGAWADAWDLGARTIASVPAMVYDDTFSIEHAQVPVFYGSKSWYHVPDGQAWPSAKYLEVEYGAIVLPNRTSTLTANRATASVDKTFSGSAFAGSGVELKTTFTATGSYEGERATGTITTWWEGSGFVNTSLADVTTGGYNTVFNGSLAERGSSSHTTMVMQAVAALPVTTLFRSEVIQSAESKNNDYRVANDYETGVWGSNYLGTSDWFYYNTFPMRGDGWEPARRSLWGQTMYNPADPAHPENIARNAAADALVESYNGRMVDAYPAFPLMTLRQESYVRNTVVFTAETIDYIYADIDEEVFIYLRTSLSYQYKTIDGTAYQKSYSLSAEYVLSTRHGGGTYPVGSTAIEEPFVSFLTTFVSPGENLGIGGGIGAYHAHFLPIPIFAPVFMEQGSCPWVSYTTKAEEYSGTPPEIHVDFTLQAAKYSTVALYAGMKYSGTVGFVPHQFLNLYQRYLKQPGPPTRNYGLFAQMFGTPTRIQFSNVGGSPYDFSEDIKLQLSRI